MISRKDKSILSPSTAGFSMIDVLVSIVVLATALLALAALQGALTRNAADARARSQIASYTEGLIDQMRAAGYGNIVAGTITPDCTASATKQEAEACAAETVAGVSKLTTTIESTPYYADLTTGVFGTSVVTGATGKYDQVKLTTSWLDAAGQPRQLVFDTIVSPVQVDQNNKTLASTNLLPQIGNTPIVRQFNPGLTNGVIPIAMGTTGNSTAATNPQPEILGKNNNQFIGGVSYNVLTYAAPETIDGQANQTRITQNLATRIIRCSCKYLASPSSQSTTNVFTQPYRPTYWDASQVKYVAPAKTTAQYSDTGQDTTATQDTNCDVCCRDRNDSATDTIRFNPWNTSDNSHYRYATSTDTVPVVVPTSNTTDAFINACRLIIVDGEFRVATDMQNYFFGYVGTDTAAVQGIPTGSTSGNVASSPLPTDAYTVDYQTFVTSYLLKDSANTALITSSVLTTSNYPLNGPSDPTSANNASALYASNNLTNPTNINITYVDPGNNKTAECIPTGTQDCRYLHARGLYVDHLEDVTLRAINNALSTCASSSATDIQNCLLPLLPFTTINLTQLAAYSENAGTNVTASNTALTGGNPDQPLRGVVSALSTGTNNTTDHAVATIGVSNTGVIGTLNQGGISPTDVSTTLTASQQFTLTSGGAGGGGTVAFDVVLKGGAIGTGANTPSVGWAGSTSYFTSGSAVTTKPCTSGTSPNAIITYVGVLTNNCNNSKPNLATASQTPAGVQVTIQNYNVSTPGTGGTGAGCTTKQGQNTIQPTNTTCSVYSVASIDVNGTAVSGWTATPSATGTNSIYGLNASTLVTVPTGLTSSNSASPDLINITTALDPTNTYTKAYTCAPVGCTGAGSNKCTFTAGTCNP